MNNYMDINLNKELDAVRGKVVKCQNLAQDDLDDLHLIHGILLELFVNIGQILFHVGMLAEEELAAKAEKESAPTPAGAK